VSELEQRWNDVGEFIREQRRSGQLSLRKLSELAGISNPYLSQVERGLRRPSAEILQRIAKALEISSETLYVRAGILDEPDADDLVAHIRRDRLLSEDQKRTLVHIYNTFITGNGDGAGDAGDANGPARSARPNEADDADSGHTDSGIGTDTGP